MSKPVIAVDFDGVIHDFANPVPGRKMGPPMRGAQEGMRYLSQLYEVVVFTARGDRPKHVEDWLHYFDIPFSRVTNIKEEGFVAIIDDIAERFTSWEAIVAPHA